MIMEILKFAMPILAIIAFCAGFGSYVRLYTKYHTESHPGFITCNPRHWFSSPGRKASWYRPEGQTLRRRSEYLLITGVTLNLLWVILFNPYSIL